MSEEDWKFMSKHNKSAMLSKNCIKFVPYGTEQALPVLGKAKVQLQCEEGKHIYTMVYGVAGQQENLVRERDAVILGIITIKPRGTSRARVWEQLGTSTT